ncbi:polysaccharide deacetylase family protein [Paenibacillus sp. S150]|uniref:polysaccharide deacetylase family protein n=1 Tax=Paenibacillus sp. S150 TaxID=2749826 RepID=UPI001C55A117|nr:polysaccharide deacetylase family protein [Paenibacillus sp. S150]MBW4084500.1 polysaccharide deacetylase family protein [Paenibacillus sp. S150]
MPLLEPNAALMVELLSLEHKQNSYQMEVGLTHSGGFTRKVLLIDEFTYLQMNRLDSVQGQRVRLSLYTKWDPFRRTYLSSFIKMNRSCAETLYFACSEAYVSQLAQLKQYTGIEPPADMSTVQASVPSPSPEPHHAQPPKQSTGTFRMTRSVVLRCILLSLLFILFFLRMDGTLFNSAEAHEDFTGPDTSTDSSVSVAYVPAIQVASFQGAPVKALPAPETETEQEPKPGQEESTQAQNPLVEELELDESSYEYNLEKGYVALSFDDGPSQYTREIVDILSAHGVAANFLFIGKNEKQHPEAVRYADEHGMPVGSHSWDHSDMTRNSSGENRSNLSRSIQVLEQNAGRPVTIFRPPYGAINDDLAAEARKQHLKVLLWNRDPEDWKADSVEQILNYFYNTDPSGGIYLLHEKAVTVKALPAIIEYLKAKQLKFAVFK